MSSEPTRLASVSGDPAPRRRFESLRPAAGIAVGCLAAGALICFSMPPWGFWPLAVVGVAALDRLLAGQGAARRLRRGGLISAAWLLGATIWMWDFSPGGYLVANLIFSLFYSAGCALTPPDRGRRPALVGWLVLIGYLRWRFPFGGVPLATLAHSQADAPLAVAARLGGPLTVVALVAVAGVSVSLLAERRWRGALAGASLIALALALSADAPRGTDTGTIKVALVQGGGPQRTRAAGTDFTVVMQRHLDATDTIAEPVDLIVWPENVVNVDGRLVDSPQLRQLADVAGHHETWFVAGVVEDGEPGEFLNFAVALSPAGELVDRYDKVRRVPFGEYVPLRSLFEPLAGDILPSKDARAGTEPAVLDTGVGRVGVLISWEVFFEDRARDAIGNGGTVLLNPTNGSSYWLTIVQSQQVASSRLRAIETGRWVLQAAPTGFSAVVNPDGEVLARTGVSEQAVLIADVATRTGRTWALRVGPWPLLALAAAAVAAAASAARRARPPAAAFVAAGDLRAVGGRAGDTSGTESERAGSPGASGRRSLDSFGDATGFSRRASHRPRRRPRT
ncbi:MAG: apolipoprotein N-acyltransferase [Acidimicrobiia bacterium]|nr:apolipoprotein N-acyltransferase [Acidimicrobiia bacterium]MYC46696.1 apolipoprotein N-acyltransferase [Acidimicrobiia bacterium]